MRIFVATIFFALAAQLIQLTWCHSSEGKAFWTAFIRNNAGQADKYLILFNDNDDTASVQITNNNVIQGTNFSLTVAVLPFNYTKVTLPKNIVSYGSGYWNLQPPSSIHIRSSASISVVAQNSLTGGASGDAHLVLPVSSLGTDYTVALSTIAQGKNQIIIITTQPYTTIVHHQLSPEIVVGSFRISEAGAMFAYANDGPFGFLISSNKPIVVLAGTDCTGHTNCDHRVTMVPPSICDQPDQATNGHFVQNLAATTNRYSILPQCKTDVQFQIDGGTMQRKLLLDYDQITDDKPHVFKTNYPVQVSRSNVNGGQSLLQTVLSSNQFVTGTVSFMAVQDNNNYVQMLSPWPQPMPVSIHWDHGKM